MLARVFAALGDPTRVELVTRLATGDASVTQLAEPLPMTQQAVSRHLRVLEDAGLVSRGRQAQARPAHLEVERLEEVLAWVGDRRREWLDRHERLAGHLAEIQEEQR